MPSTPMRPNPSITLRGISACRSISAASRSSFKNLRSSVRDFIQLALFRLRDARIRHHPIRYEMPLEKPFRKPQRLGSCKEQFLSLLNLFLSLFVELVHSIEKRATNSSQACSHVQSGASTPCRPNASGFRTSMLQATDPRFVLSYSPGSCRIRCRRRRRRRE